MVPPKSRYLSTVVFLLTVLLSRITAAQPTTQDCLGAIPVCGSTLTNGIVTGTGNITNEINPISSCLLTGERNDTWYLIGIGMSGQLQFSIVPNNLTENYNWAIYDLTNASCSAIFTNPALEVECNYSNLPGITGANGQPGPQNHAPIPVTAGQVLVLNISAFSSINQSGYTLDFGGTALGVIDNQAPSLIAVSAMNCGATSIGITFSEMIDCSTVTAAGFQLTGPGGPYTITGVTASNCSAGGDFSKSYTVTFTPALVASGTYTLNLVNPVSDVCGNPTPLPQAFSFPVSSMTVNFTQTNVTCFGGNNGSLTANITGSAGPFTYQWSPSGGSGATAQFLSAGTYSVTVTNAGGCSVTASTTISQPLTGLTATSVVTPANGCAANGTATVSVGNGQPPFTYSWWPTGGNAATATGLSAGGYMVTITDANQCALNYFLNVPSANGPSASIISTTDVSCFGGTDGSATVSVTGATGPFTYSWSPSGGNAATATGLSAGNYTVNVTVNSTCVLTATVVIAQPPTPLSATVTSTSTTCGNTNGFIQVNASGSVPPYVYAWTPSVTTGSTASGLAAGTYNVTVTDANGCTSSNSVVIAPSSAPVLSISGHANVTCNGLQDGATGVSVAGGSVPYTYLWSNGQTTASLSGIPSGTYTVTVTDASGCTATLTDVINQPVALSLNLTGSQNILCFGDHTGSAAFNAAGGTGTYTWNWNGNVSSASSANALPAGTYTVTVTDQNGCSAQSQVVIQQPAAPLGVQSVITNTQCGNSNGSVAVTVNGGSAPYAYLWSTGATAASISGLGAGLYSLTITDNNGCSLTDTYPVQSSGAPLVSVVSITDVTCHGGNNGAAILNATGGIQPYTWVWSGGVSSGPAAVALQAGNYTVTVTDASGCTSFQQVSIFEPNALSCTVSGPSSVCQGNPISLTSMVQGGTAPYQYQWTTGSTASSISVTPATTTSYSLTVTDANGCTAPPFIFPVTVADPLQLTLLYPDSVCQGMEATVAATATGGDGNYIFQWSNGMSGASNSITINAPVQIQITVVDGCGSPAAQQTFSIAMVTAPVLNVSLDPQKGCQPFTATFALPAGPQTGVSYLWDFGDGSTLVSPAASHTYGQVGTYQVNLSAWSTAAPGCSTTVNVNGPVTVLPVPVARFEFSPAVPTVNRPEVRFDDRSTYASSWRWNFGDNSPEELIPDPVHMYRGAGAFAVRLQVATQDGCTDSLTRIVEVVEEMQFFIPNAFTADDNGVNDKFDVVGVGYESYEVSIYDRWGKLVHYSKNGSDSWDGNSKETGKPLPQGLYICKITMHDKLGNVVTKFSQLTLLR